MDLFVFVRADVFDGVTGSRRQRHRTRGNRAAPAADYYVGDQDEELTAVPADIAQ
ncbi:hypothetical protein VA596_25540 [Amycolatopsis sp., V23-08]|uniref:Uncharacterized protein n=1 Tax=Amycolatopsis heterodermiae TaxID=3110235 RepID=A0ABU5R9J3_9PSEU|nr:hypothetical protein [Amycolatopsis sp., V23-08]MEA5362918.1 hypothetical protein [Amycolatopsis sp., V23-08]